MERLKEIISRKPNRWKNLTIKEFERDIKLLQDNCNHLVIRNEYVEHLKRDNDIAYDILANVREKLLPLVNPEGNVCGDMTTCTVSNPKCIECLAEQIVEQYKGFNEDTKYNGRGGQN